MTKSADKPPAIDIDMLTMALQAGDLDTAWWLDTQNGDVIPAPEPDGDAIEQKLIKERQRSPDRYIDIKPIANSIHIELMESYIATNHCMRHYSVNSLCGISKKLWPPLQSVKITGMPLRNNFTPYKQGNG
jgi:hypothetical protein